MLPKVKKRTKLLVGVGAASTVSAFCLLGTAAPLMAVGQIHTPGADFSGGVGRSQAETEIQRRVEAIVLANPGSRQINENEVELQPGAIVTVPRREVAVADVPGPGAALAAVPDCPYQYSCWYEHAGFQGYRLALRDCTFHNLGLMTMPDGRAWNDKVTSWHNNLRGGVAANVYNWNGDTGWFYMFQAKSGSQSYVGDAENEQIDAILNCVVP